MLLLAITLSSSFSSIMGTAEVVSFEKFTSGDSIIGVGSMTGIGSSLASGVGMGSVGSVP